MDATEKKRKSLVLTIVLSIGLVILCFNSILIAVISTRTRSSLSEQYIADCSQIAFAHSYGFANLISGYEKELDYYVNADVMKTGSEEEIGAWLVAHENKRSSDFDYIMFCGPEGVAYTDLGKRTDVKDRSYFKAIMQDGNVSFIDDPVISKTTGQAVFHVTRAVKSGTKTIGFIAGVVNVNYITTISDTVKLGKTGYAWIVSGDGTVLAHKNKDFVMKKNFINDVSDDHKDISIVASAMTKPGVSGYTWINGLDSKKDLVTYVNIPGTSWGFAFSVSDTQVYETADILRNIMIVATVINLLFILLFVNILVWTAIKPLKTVQNTISGIASGNADLTRRIEIRSNNEIGAVVEGFNKFSGKLQEIVKQLKLSKDTLSHAGDSLHESTEETSASITEIIANIESMGNRITSQSASVEETAGAVNEIASNIASLERMIESQAAGVSQASAAVEQMIGNINAVDASVEKMAQSFTQLEQNARDGAAKQDDVNGRIEQIEGESEMLQEANQAIASIAEQTNLLAMNAAIEAAHAGEAGKGFSVVADEIRKLSETSTSQSKTIGDQLTKIKDSINSVVTASAESSRTFNEVAAGIKDTDELVRQIKDAMQEQNEGSKQISIALHTMNDSTSEVRTASAEMSAGNKAILEEVKNLQDATMSMKDSMNEMGIGAKKINETGVKLTEISSEMKTTINNIGQQIDQFKV